MLGSTNSISHPRGSLFDDDVDLEEKEQPEPFLPQPVVTSDSVGSPPRRVVSRNICKSMLHDASHPACALVAFFFVSIGALILLSRVLFSMQTPSPLPLSAPAHDARGLSQVTSSRCIMCGHVPPGLCSILVVESFKKWSRG